MRRLLAVLMLFVPLPALAQQELTPLMALLPDPLPTPYAFMYTAPRDGFGPDSPTLHGPADRMLARVLAAPSGVDPITGVNFSAVTGVLQMGEPPEEFALLLGRNGFADGLPAALAARGFQTRLIGGVEVHGLGEDNALDVTGRDDPLGGGIGKAQRLFVQDGALIRAANWASAEAAVARLGEQEYCRACATWAPLFAGVSATGPNPHLDAAFGWIAIAFIDTPPGVLFTDYEGKEADKARAKPLALPAFTHALMALTQDGAGARTHLAMLFASPADARTGAAEVARRLTALNPGMAVSTGFQTGDLGTAAILTVAATDPVAARDLYANWVERSFKRAFVPLLIAP